LICIASSISILAWQGWKGLLSIICFWVDMQYEGSLDSIMETSVKPNPLDQKRKRILLLFPVTGFFLCLPFSAFMLFFMYNPGGTAEYLVVDSPWKTLFLLAGIYFLNGIWGGIAFYWFVKQDLLVDYRRVEEDDSDEKKSSQASG